MIHELTNIADFETLTKEGEVLVDFFATWCPPCQMMLKVIDTMQDAEFDILKVDIDKFPELAQKFGVMTIPTLVAIKDGQEVKKMIGVTPKEELLSIFK